MAVVLYAAEGFLYPSAEAAELGWWATPLGEGVGLAVRLVAVPGAVAFLLTYGALAAVGLPEAVAVVAGAGVVGGALWWGGLAAVVVWVRKRRAALREPWDRWPPWRP